MDGSGGQDMLSQQRMLQSYMDNLFGPQQNGNNNPANPGAGPVNVGAGGIGPGIQMPQQQQQAMHPGVPAIFQNAQRYQANDGPGNGYGQQQQQPFQPNNAQQQQQQNLWQQQLTQQQQQQQQAQRPIFPATTTGSNQSGQMTQAEIQAMLTSLGQQSHIPTLPLAPSSSSNNNAGMPGNNTTPQPQFAMNQFLQQQQQQQANPAAYNAQLQAAIQHMQQQQQGHLNSSTPPPPNNAAAQAAALLMAQQQQQQAALAAGNLNGGMGNVLQQGGQIDPAILLKLRQSGMNLTPEQHVMLSSRMLRRGGIADGPQQQQGGGGGQQQPPAMQGSPQQQQQHLLQQQLQRQLPTASLPLGLSNLQPAVPHQTPQGQQQNLFPSAPPPLIPQQQQQNQQQPQAGGFPNSIPLNVLQEFTTISEQLRTYTTTEQHLAMCLAQNLHIPKQLSGNQN
jgi:hypothetical protein